MKFGERLQQTRQQKNLTQSQVATSLHVSRQTISSWETGHSYPDIDSLIKLSDLYTLSLDVLLKEDNGMTDTLRKPEVLHALHPTIRNLTIMNIILMVTLLFDDQFTSAKGLLLPIALLNFWTLNQLNQFASSLTQEDPATRWPKSRLWLLLFAVISTVGVAMAWHLHRPGLLTDILYLAIACWVGLLFGTIKYSRRPVSQ